MPIPRHRALKHIALRRAMHPSIQRNYLSEEMFWEPGSSLTESHVCFTVSPSLGLPVFWLVFFVCFLFGFLGGAVLLFVLFCWLTGFPVLCIWDAQVRRHFQDCHHRHDERSNGAKKTKENPLARGYPLPLSVLHLLISLLPLVSPNSLL